MSRKAQWSFCFCLLVICISACQNTNAITPEEKAKRSFIAKTIQENQSLVEKKEYGKSIEFLKKASKRYQEPVIYKKIIESARELYQQPEVKGKDKDEAYMVALENGVEYCKTLQIKKKPAELKEALVFLGKRLVEIFSNISIKKYDEALNLASDISALISQNTSSEAQFYMGVYSLYGYRLRKSQTFLKNSAHLEGTKLLRLIKKILKNQPKSAVGKKLVFRKKINRGEAGAFFFHEMKANKTSLPDSNRIPDWNGESIRDLDSFWAQNEVKFCLKLGVMQLLGANMFQPLISITRYEVAILITRALIIGTGDFKIREKYAAEPNPFLDPINEFGKDSNIPFAIAAFKEGFFSMGNDKKFYPNHFLDGVAFSEILQKINKKIAEKK